MTTTAALDIKVGTFIEPDGWRFGEKLEPGLEEFCDFYLPTGLVGPIKHLAVNIRVTGRKAIKRSAYNWDSGSNYWARVEITFVGDGEPNTIHHGWTPCEWGWGR